MAKGRRVAEAGLWLASQGTGSAFIHQGSGQGRNLLKPNSGILSKCMVVGRQCNYLHSSQTSSGSLPSKGARRGQHHCEGWEN